MFSQQKLTRRPQICGIFLEPPSHAQPIVAMASKASLLVGLLLLLSLLMCAQGEIPCNTFGAYSSQFHRPQGGSAPFNFRWSWKISSLDFCHAVVLLTALLGSHEAGNKASPAVPRKLFFGKMQLANAKVAGLGPGVSGSVAPPQHSKVACACLQLPMGCLFSCCVNRWCSLRLGLL